MRYLFKVKGMIEPMLFQELREYVEEHFMMVSCEVITENRSKYYSVTYEFMVPEDLRPEAISIIHLFDDCCWEETDLAALEMIDRMGIYFA